MHLPTCMHDVGTDRPTYLPTYMRSYRTSFTPTYIPDQSTYMRSYRTSFTPTYIPDQGWNFLGTKVHLIASQQRYTRHSIHPLLWHRVDEALGAIQDNDTILSRRTVSWSRHHRLHPFHSHPPPIQARRHTHTHAYKEQP